MVSENLAPLAPDLLPNGVASRFAETASGLRMHYLEAGASLERPLLLLLHGFPELAYSWRNVMPLLAEAGYHVVAPDQRGYGRTTGWTAAYDDDISPYGMLGLARDALAFVVALGRPNADCVVGHDFGSPVAAWCALTRPDVFQRLILMSAPFAGPPALGASRGNGFNLKAELAALDPPRKHYQWYYSTREADSDMRAPPQGLHDFLRAYFHVKSADWPGNAPHPLGLSAAEMAKLPRYYIMDQDADMPATVAPEMPSREHIARTAWLADAELAFYVGEFGRTGFQGGLNWYHAVADPGQVRTLEVFAGRTIDVPTMFIGGAADWGVHQTPGAFEAMSRRACSQFCGTDLVQAAGHWVQQEQPEAVARGILDFMRADGPRKSK